MNDVLLLGADKAVIEMLKGKLTARFKMTGMGDMSLVLGIQLSCNLEQGGTDD